MTAFNYATIYLVAPVTIVSCIIIAELDILPRLGNQLGGMPVLIRGRCVDPGFVLCRFDGTIASMGTVVNEETVLCSTPIMNTQGPVMVEIQQQQGANRRFTTIASGTFNAGTQNE